MQIKIKTNIKELTKSINAKFKLFEKEIVKAMHRAAIFFISDIQSKQMSGRKSGDRYLNVRSGKLRRDWFSEITHTNYVYTLAIRSTTPYTRYHQYGTRYLKKRLFINERWNTFGKTQLRLSIEMAARMFKGG